MLDYSKGKIYIIRSPHTDDVYIGSTIQSLSKRMGGHRTKYSSWKNGNTDFCSSFNLIELGDAYIELVEEYSCENKNQLERREGEIMRQTENCINKQVAGRTLKEYYRDNKEMLLVRQKIYIEQNKDKVKEGQKEYYEKNKDTISEYQKKYRAENKDKRKEYDEKNREKIREQAKLSRLQRIKNSCYISDAS